MNDIPTLIERAKADPAMIRDYVPDGARSRKRLTDAAIATALGYTGPGGRDTVRQMARGAARPETTRLLLLALLDGWRPADRVGSPSA